MNLDELATNVARDIGAVRQRSCKRADGVEYHFEQSELEQFAKELIAEYEKTVNSELYPRPDPRVAELEAKLQQMNSLCEFNERTMSDIASKYEALEAQNSALLVAMEAKDAALDSLVSWVDDWAETSDTDFTRIETQVNAARALSTSAELLESRDRKRDAVPDDIRKDAERYLWLKSQKGLNLSSCGGSWIKGNIKFNASHRLCANDTAYAPYETLDEAIDAAIAASPELGD